MKTKLILLVSCLLALSLAAQTRYTAVDVPAGTPGNMAHVAWAVGNDFYVLKPITVWQLGIFDDQGDGIQGSAVLTVQLFSHQGNSGTLLETLTFDAANPGKLVGGNRVKGLALPVTLLPGPYSILAYGFDGTNRACEVGRPPYNAGRVAWALKDGGGLIRFEQGRHGKAEVNEFPHGQNPNQPSHYAGATFVYSAAAPSSPPSAADYKALTAGVTQFPFIGRRRTGSIAVFNYNSFPVLVEPSGNRLVVEAAGKYNDDPNGGRCVIFAHSQWGRMQGDGRALLFENAVRWAGRKSSAADTMVAIGPGLDTNYFGAHGYQVKELPTQLASPTDTLPVCDVMVVNWNTNYDKAVQEKIAEFTAHGGGLVVTMMPWLLLHGAVQPSFGEINDLIQPFGVAYRPSTELTGDQGFTNIAAQPYPAYFSAYPAAGLLGEDHLGRSRLSSLEKVIALNTINAAVNARPDLLPELAALSVGRTNTADSASQPAGVSGFVDVAVLAGAQASTNRLGHWAEDGTDLVALGPRGAVEYEFSVTSPDVYRLEIDGTQNHRWASHNDFDLWLHLDGVNLGHQHLVAGPGTNGVVQCLTPYLLAGWHTLRVLWDNAGSFTSLKLQAVRVQTGVGPDSDGSGVKDWVKQLVRSRSGLDLTNQEVSSYVSPVCLEGRDPYPSLMQLSVQGSQNQVPLVNRGPGGRWYANVALPRAQNTPLVLTVSYENGAFSEWRSITWQPVNLLDGGSWTLRRGDSLLLMAQPAGAPATNMVITVGTNQLPVWQVPQPCQFKQAGVFTVTGTYQGAMPQSGSITVRVVDYSFPGEPDCWVSYQRYWDLTNVPSEMVLDSDPKLIMETIAKLPDRGQRTALLASQHEPLPVLARLGAGGSILDSTGAKGFELWTSADTYVNVLDTYPDGSQLVETLLVLSPVLADVSVQMDVIVGGVVFTDGTTSKKFTAADFDTLGRCKVQFVRPASARTSVCHSVKAFQGDVLVGYRR
jgi:hypothetical protein